MIEQYELQVVLNGFGSPCIYTNKFESEKEAKLALDQIESEDSILCSRIVKITKTLLEQKEVIVEKTTFKMIALQNLKILRRN